MTRRKPGNPALPASATAVSAEPTAPILTEIELDAALDLARRCLARALSERDAAEVPKDQLAWDGASRAWLEILLSALFRKMERHQTAEEVWDTFLEAIRRANERQMPHS